MVDKLLPTDRTRLFGLSVPFGMFAKCVMIFEVFPADIARAMVRLVMTPQMLSKLTAVFKQLSAKLTSLFNITFVDQVPMLIPLDKTNKIFHSFLEN